MLYVILVLIFIIVFVYLGWRVIVQQRPKTPKPDKYVCPSCNEAHCVCHKTDDEA